MAEREPMTPGQKADIDQMTQEDMARLHRFAPVGHPYFNITQEASAYFHERFKGFTPELSKQVGWDK